MQRTSPILVSLALTLFAASASATTCGENACEVGQHVTTYSAPGEPVAACPTDALAAYSNFTLYLVASDAASTQQATVDPNAIEAKATGDMADVAKRLREASGVASANDALKACSPLKAGASVVVVEVSKKTNNAKVSGANGEAAFWIPTEFLDR
ncbi:hypothetical protein [Luteibacter aegosomatissinici]|uniref:hypothetical protein n=1 Tax=Luteibacter aegosomatissinici TaxID=2911539 RepID=UPI001FFAD91A|nr:hypothetical protein [Luteibacter aegosomatissinici]UPG93883.1 hypothetical protein L2Y97_18915 [Luteibacter aegosomatissinici]